MAATRTSSDRSARRSAQRRWSAGALPVERVRSADRCGERLSVNVVLPSGRSETVTVPVHSKLLGWR